MPRETSAGGLVLRERDGTLELAVIRPRGKTVWALPKGHVDAGETPEQAAQREVREETGLETTLIREVGEIRYVYQFRGKRIYKAVRFYLFHYLSGEIGHIAKEMEVEVAEARWIPFGEAQRLLAYRGEKEMAQKAAELLGLAAPETVAAVK